MTTSPFDHRPDDEIGKTLRKALTAHDDDAFVQRVRIAADHVYGQQPAGLWLEELIHWARPGLAAAAGVAAAAVLWLGTLGGPTTLAPVTVGDPLTDIEELSVPVLLAGPSAPGVDVVLAVALGNGK